MLREIGVSPCVFRPGADLRDWPTVTYLLSDALSDCILLNYRDGTWFDEVRRRLALLSPEQAKTAMMVLSRFSDRRRLRWCAREPGERAASDVGWLQELLAIHFREPLFALIARRDTIASCPGAGAAREQLLPLDAVPGDRRWTERPRMVSVQRSSGSVLRAMRPLLRFSERIHLIDYKALEVVACQRTNATRFVEFIASCLDEWSAGPGDKVEFVISSLHSPACIGVVPVALEKLRERIAQCRHPAGRVLLKCWRGRTRDFAKNRYLVSERGGIWVGKGFDPVLDERACRSTDQLTLLSEEGVRSIENEFRRYRCECEFDLLKGGGTAGACASAEPEVAGQSGESS